MILSNDGLVAFHYRSYGTFFLQQNRLHNIHRDLPTTNIIEPLFFDNFVGDQLAVANLFIAFSIVDNLKNGFK